MVSKLFIMIIFFLISGKRELRARKLGNMPMAGIVSPFLLVTSLLSSCFSSPSLPRCVLNDFSDNLEVAAVRSSYKVFSDLLRKQ